MMKKYKLVFISLFTFLLSTNSHAGCTILTSGNDCPNAGEICRRLNLGGTSCQKCSKIASNFPNADKRTNVCYNDGIELNNHLGHKVTTYDPNLDLTQYNEIICDATKHAHLNNDHSDCVCDNGYEYNENKESCLIQEKNIKIDRNDSTTQQGPLTLYIRYLEGYSCNNTSFVPKDNFQIYSCNNTFFKRNFYSFKGVYTESTGGKKIFEPNYSPTFSSLTFWTDNSLKDLTTFYAQWTPQFKIEYKIKYLDNSQSTWVIKYCHTGDCDTLLKYTYSYKPQGYVFDQWACSATNGKTVNKKEGDPLANLAEQVFSSSTADLPPDKWVIQCVTQFVKCKKGQYCDASGSHDCPAGTTSDDGAEAITDCFVNGDTVFKDNVGSFSLPNIKIYYKK